MKKRLPLVIVILATTILSVHAQYEQLLHKTHAERLEPLLLFYNDTLVSADSVFLFNRIKHIRQLAVDNKDEDLLLEAMLMRAHYFYYRPKFNGGFVLSIIDSVKTAAIKQKKIWAESLAENMAALYCFTELNQYELGFEKHKKVYNLIKNLSPKDFPYKQNCLFQMADEYYLFHDFKEAIFYGKQAWEAVSPVINNLGSLNMTIANTIGLCYQKLNMLDSSDYWFNETYVLASKHNSVQWRGIASGNLGYNLFLKGQYAIAIPMLQKDVDIAINHRDWGLAAGSLMVLGDIALQLHDLQKASVQLQTARQYVYQSGQYNRLQQLYPLLSKLYAFEGQPGLAAMFLDSTLFVKDSLDRKLNAMQLLRANQKVELEQYRAEVETVLARKKLSLLERNILIVAVVLMMVVVVLVYRQQKKKYALKQQEFKKAEVDLMVASGQLNDFARNMSEKNALIEMLQQQAGGSNNHGTLLQLQQSTILTDDDWDYFRELFEKVHAGFLQRLKEKLPGLTPAETRFIVLSKLKLSNKEMASMLGIGTDTIRQHRSRLRRKLELGEGNNLDDLIENI